MAPTKITRRKSGSKAMRSILAYMHEFSQETSIHGISHIFCRGRHLFERIDWVAVLGVAIYGCGLIIESNITHFQENPTVISLERDFRSWNTTFPAVTICYDNPLDAEAAQNLSLRKWGKYITATSGNTLDYYIGFLSAVANASYKNLHNFLPYVDDASLAEEDILPLAMEVTKEFSEDVYIYYSESNHPLQTLTEIGLCYTIGSAIAKYTTPTQSATFPPYNFNYSRQFSRAQEKEVTMDEPKLPICNILNSLCYGRFRKLSGKINYYVHSAHEVPIWGSRSFSIDTQQERDTTFIPLTIVASSDLRNLYPNQRRCLFLDEGQIDISFTKTWQPSNTDILKKLESPDHLIGGNSFQCVCYPQCEDVTFLLDRNQLKMQKPAKRNLGFRVAVEYFSRTRYRREVIFGFDDLLVSLGGTAGLFLGCSLLSAAELIYFFTIHLGFRLLYQKDKKDEYKEGKRKRKWKPANRVLPVV